MYQSNSLPQPSHRATFLPPLSTSSEWINFIWIKNGSVPNLVWLIINLTYLFYTMYHNVEIRIIPSLYHYRLTDATISANHFDEGVIDTILKTIKEVEFEIFITPLINSILTYTPLE